MRIAIVGGGPAGSTAARLLASWGFDVTVISTAAPAKAGEVIGPEAAPVLAKLRLDVLFAASPDIASRCDGVLSQWPPAGLSRSDYRLRGATGWVIDRPRLDAALRRLAIDSGCRWQDAKVTACRRLEDGAFELSVRRGNELDRVTAGLVIDATGRPARIARQLGARRLVDDWLIAAAIKFPRGTQQADPFLRLTGTAQGWWYRSDGPAGDTRIACIADPVLGGAKPSVLDSHLRDIARAHGFAGSSALEVTHMDASSAHLECCARDGWLAAGDAGTNFDPFTGQGLAHAFGCGLSAAHAAREYLAGNGDALAAHDHAVQATYRFSRQHLVLRYAYYAQCNQSEYWRARQAKNRIDRGTRASANR